MYVRGKRHSERKRSTIAVEKKLCLSRLTAKILRGIGGRIALFQELIPTIFTLSTEL